MQIIQRFSNFALVAGLVATAHWMVGAQRADASDTIYCDVTAIEGAPVRVQTADGWAVLQTGQLPEGASTIATGPGARTRIECSDGLVVTIGTGTEVTLDSLLGVAEARRTTVFGLLQGIIGLNAPDRTPEKTHIREGLQVRTPLAIASARTTAWLVEYAPATGVSVFVRDGVVDVADPGGTTDVVLVAGEGVSVLPGMLPDLDQETGRPRSMSSADGPIRFDVVRWGQGRVLASGGALGFDWQ